MATAVAFETVERPEMDVITFEVLKNALVNLCEEMALTVRRAAYSTNIKTRADFSCAFFDRERRCIAQSFAQPAHLVAMATLVPNALAAFGPENLDDGDALIVNDPHLGSSHLNDIVIITTVHAGGERIGYVANMAHHVDVGGSSPASLGVNRELYQEGVIIPPTRIVRRGELDENLLGFLLANIRAPRETNGDLRAQLSANWVGVRRMEALVHRYASAVIESFCDEVIAYTERWTEREIRSLPEGTYRTSGFRDDDGFSDHPIRLELALTVKDGRMILDMTGSDAQRRSPINCTRAMTRCGLAFITRCLVDDRLPVNDGFLRRLEVTGPDGLICTALRPAAVVGGWEMASRITELIWLALHPALPGRVPAAGKGLIVNLGFGGHDPRKGEYYCYMETIAGGNGARPTKDGPDAVQTNLHNTENAPVEEVELNYPIRFRRYELITDSGGAGRFRGGLGIRRDFEFPYAECTFTVLSDGRKFAPWGLAGGHDGRPAHFILEPEGEGRELPSKITIDVPKGGCVRAETPGGGGFGPPAERERAAVARDLEEGKISAETAREIYGYRV